MAELIKRTSTNTAEVLMDVGDDIPDLGSKMTDPKPPDTAPIDLPVSTADDITLPEMEIVDDFFEDADDTDALLSVDAAPVPDFAKEMAIEEGIDRDLEVKLENLAFLDKRKNEPTKMDKQQTKCYTRKNTQSVQQRNKPVTSNKTPIKTTDKKAGKTSTAPKVSATPSTLGSPKGHWKTTKYGIRKKYGPSHPQNYGCKVCCKLLQSRGELNQHHRLNHPPVLCPVCKKSFSCPNT